MFSEEPFRMENLAAYRFTEFRPVRRQPWAEPWFADAPA
jgi:hypothetical protein